MLLGDMYKMSSNNHSFFLDITIVFFHHQFERLVETLSFQHKNKIFRKIRLVKDFYKWIFTYF